MTFGGEGCTFYARAVSAFTLNHAIAWVLLKLEDATFLPKTVDDTPLERISASPDGWCVFANKEVVAYKSSREDARFLFAGHVEEAAQNAFVNWLLFRAAALADPGFVAFAHDRLRDLMKRGGVWKTEAASVSVVENSVKGGAKGLLMTGDDAAGIYNQLFNQYTAK